MRVILAIVAAFGVGKAMENTGLAAFVADQLVTAFIGLGAPGILAAIAVVSIIIGSAVSNNATVILMVRRLVLIRDWGWCVWGGLMWRFRWRSLSGVLFSFIHRAIRPLPPM